jgi:predicted ABC-type ATPase
VKEIVILGGPNGAGKTTAARMLLPALIQVHAFLNADEIAREICPEDVDSAALAAGREMLKRIQDYVRTGASFGLETTCSGRSYARLLERCKRDGWRITLLFLWISSPEIAVRRINRRVRQGGHNIPPNIVRRRYSAGLANLMALYLPLADEVEVYDNTGKGRVLIAEKRGGGRLRIHDATRWTKMKKAAQ